MTFHSKELVPTSNKYQRINIKKKLYNSLVIWSNNYSTFSNKLNNIQYKYLKTVAFITQCTISRDSFLLVQYSLGIDSLNIRRDLIDIMFVYDILNNNVKCPAILNLIWFRIPSRFTWNSNLFHVPNFNTNSGKNYFFSRAVFNANRISTVLDFFVLSRQVFKAKTLLCLKHNA